MSVKKILVIDDEEYFCWFLKKSLELRGPYQVLIATRGSDGLRLAKTQKPDVILLDIMMPDMSGSHVAEELADDPATSSIPVIFVTAVITPSEIKKRGGIAGGRTIIAKPIKLDELIKKMDEL